MVMFTFPVRDDDRMERRRQRAIGLRRRYGKRQGVVAGAPDEVEEEKEVESEESGSESESDSEDEDETKSNTAPSAQTQTSSPPSTIAPPSQATATNVLATESTSAAAITASVSPQSQIISSSSVPLAEATPVSNTSIQENRNQQPSPSSIPTDSSSFISISRATSSSVSGAIVPGPSPSPDLLRTTAAQVLPSAPSSSPTATSTAPTSGNALGETFESGDQLAVSKSPAMSRAVEATLIVISVGAAFAIVGYMGLLAFRKFRQRKERDTRSNATRSLWGGSSAGSSDAPPPIPQMTYMSGSRPLPSYAPPQAARQVTIKDDPFDDSRRLTSFSDNAVQRQERLGRVRADLLAPRELNGGLVRSATQLRSDGPPNQGHVRSASGNQNSNDVAQSSSSIAPVWPSGKVDVNTMRADDRLDIAAGGEWDDSITVARHDSRVDSMASAPKFRTPVSWARDQTRRLEGLRKLNG